MKLSKKVIILFLLLLITIFFMQYDFFKSNSYKLPSKSITYFDANIFKMYAREYNTSIDTNPYWGFSKDIGMFSDLNETNTSSPQIEVTQKGGTNSLCIKSSCYRLLGIYQQNDEKIITLYSKNIKERVKDYKEKEVLDATILINTITSNRVEFIDTNSTRKWYFKIFDVNTTKYKPKELDDENNRSF